MYVYFSKFRFNEVILIKDLGVAGRILEIIVQDNVRYRVGYFNDKQGMELRLSEEEIEKLEDGC